MPTLNELHGKYIAYNNLTSQTDIDLDSPIALISLDSLEWVDFGLELEREYGITIDDALYDSRTLRDFLEGVLKLTAQKG